MRTQLTLGVFVFLLGACASCATTPAAAPSLLGTWEGAYRALIHHPEDTISGDVHMQLVIERQDGEFLMGYHTWSLHDEHAGRPDIGGRESRGGRETLVGVLSFDGHEARMLETVDNGVFELRIAGPDTLQALYLEHHHDEATVFRVRLTRE